VVNRGPRSVSRAPRPALTEARAHAIADKLSRVRPKCSTFVAPFRDLQESVDLKTGATSCGIGGVRVII
jgi:hypothetical protein